MTSWEVDQFSYVRAARAVRPTHSMEQFLARALSIAGDDFGKGSTMKQEIVETPTLPHASVVYEIDGVEVPRVSIWRSNELKVRLFERWAPASDEKTLQYPRLIERMKKPYLEGRKKFTRPNGPKVASRRENPLLVALNELEVEALPAGEQPTVRFAGVVETNRRNSGEGRMYGLMVAESNVSRLLEAQAATLEREIGKTAVGRLVSGPHDEAQSGLVVPFLYVPDGTSMQHDNYLMRINSQLPDGTYELGSIQWSMG